MTHYIKERTLRWFGHTKIHYEILSRATITGKSKEEQRKGLLESWLNLQGTWRQEYKRKMLLPFDTLILDNFVCRDFVFVVSARGSLGIPPPHKVSPAFWGSYIISETPVQC